MEPAPRVGRVFFPLDEELGLLAGSLAPRQQEHLVHLSSHLPFAQASQMMERLLGVQVSKETARRVTEQVGGDVEAAQTAEAEAPFHEDPAAPTTPCRLALSADGALVPLVNGEWAEVRTLAIGEVVEEHTALGTHEVHVDHLSYFSRLTDAQTFADLAEGEMRRRHVVDAKEVCAVTDGADWLQGLIDLHRADAVRILDFPHAAEHLAKLLEAAEHAGLGFPAHMLTRCLHILKHRGPAMLLRMANRLPERLSEQDGIREHLGYLRKREALMQYPSFRAVGWPIGSGMVESANQLVVQARLKGAGMHWERSNVNPMLALRNGVCNQRWQETWHQAGSQAHTRQALHRTTRAQHWREARLLLCNPALLTSPALPPHPTSPPPSASMVSLPSAPAATLPGSSRPSDAHPWKRGRACAPKGVAKI